MNVLLASFIAFCAGAGLMYLAWKHLGRLGLQAMASGHPAAEEMLGTFARSSCWAHAGMLDENGFQSAAAFLILMGRTAKGHADAHVHPSGMVEKQLREKYDLVVHQGNLCFPNPGDAVECPQHGESLWAGHMQCSRCLRVYHQDDAPALCECQWPLLPRFEGLKVILPATGNRICKHCFEEGGFEPADVDPPTPAQLEAPVLDFPVKGITECGRCRRCDAELYIRFGDVRQILGVPSACLACGHSEADAVSERAGLSDEGSLPPVPTVQPRGDA